jgi:PleD family two-component response regulator
LTDSRHRVLVLEPDHDPIHLLEEAFQEMEDLWASGACVATFSREYALDPGDAAALLDDSAFDLLLLDMLGLHGLHSVELYRRLQSRAPDTPVVALIPASEEPLGLRLMREGAQDYLIREEIDCRPLARALRAAIERHRLLRALESTALTDSLTGLYNRRGFLRALRRDGLLAARLGLPYSITLYDGGSAEPQARDLRLLEAADLLRRRLPEEALAGRWDAHRLAVALFGDPSRRAFPLDNLGFRATTIDPPADSDIGQLLEQSA